MNCGECLMESVEIVPLVDGVCPRCSADYRDQAAVRQCAREGCKKAALPDNLYCSVECLYPPDWPRCPGCGGPVMDGHRTCGDVRCGGD